MIASGMMLNTLACALTYEPAEEHVDMLNNSLDTTMASSASSLETTSINTRMTVAIVKVKAVAVTAADEYYTAVVSSPSPSPPPLMKRPASATDDPMAYLAAVARKRLFGGRRTAEFLAVSAVNAISHLAYAVFVATAAPRPYSNVAATLQMAAAEAAGCVLAPTVSDLLSACSDSAPVYLNAAVMVVGGAVLLTADTLQCWQSVAQSSPSLVAFGLAFGAAVGLEPLVAVRVLGPKRLSASYSATLLGKGAAQLAVDLLFTTSPEQRQQVTTPVAFYALGSCLLAAAAMWTAAFVFNRLFTAKKGCSRYVRTAWRARTWPLTK